MRRRVVLTGMGVVCSAGSSLKEFGEKIRNGISCFSKLDDPRLKALTATLVGRADRIDSPGVPPELKSHDRVVHLAWQAAAECLSMAGVDPTEDAKETGLVFATCSGPMLSIEKHYEKIARGDESITPEQLLEKRYYAPALFLAGHFGIRGITTTVVTACSASAGALGIGADLIRSGMAEVILAGGADTLAPSTIAGFDRLKATSPSHCAPFSYPSGLVLGEGAGFFMLESEHHARGRGAEVFGEILGFGLSNDAYHPTAPEPSGRGQAYAMNRALKDAGMNPERVCYVNAHGTGTDANDRTETRALRRVFAGRSENIPVSSTKSMIGHCLGAAGALEAIASVECARNGVLPPTANFVTNREGCNLDCVSETGRSWPVGPMMSNNFAFGGNNASLIIAPCKSHEEAPPDREYTGSIVLSGFGALTAAGVGHDALLEAYRDHRCSVEDIPHDGDTFTRVSRVPEIRPGDIGRRLDVRGMDRSSVLALLSTRFSITHAGLPMRTAVTRDLGLYLSLSTGPSSGESRHLLSLFERDFDLDNVRAFPYVVQNSISGNVCRNLGIAGHNSTLCSGPGAGLTGLGLSFLALRNGHSSAMVNGAVDELSERILRDSRNAGRGFRVPGEAAAAVLLETSDHLKERGGAPKGTIRSVAFGTPCREDAEERLQAVVQDALDKAEVQVEEIGLVCVDGSAGHRCPILRDILDNRDTIVIDCEPYIGYAEASASLLNLIVALHYPAPAHNRRFILCVSYASPGTTCAMVFQR